MDEIIKSAERLCKRIENKLADLSVTRVTDDFINEAKVIISMENTMDEMLSFLRSFIIRRDNIIDLTELWHNNSEEPEDNSLIIYESIYGDYLQKRYTQVYSSMKCIKRWAYIKDLLPKGGK